MSTAKNGTNRLSSKEARVHFGPTETRWLRLDTTARNFVLRQPMKERSFVALPGWVEPARSKPLAAAMMLRLGDKKGGEAVLHDVEVCLVLCERKPTDGCKFIQPPSQVVSCDDRRNFAHTPLNTGLEGCSLRNCGPRRPWLRKTPTHMATRLQPQKGAMSTLVKTAST